MKKKLVLILLVSAVLMVMVGCASTIEAIRNSKTIYGSGPKIEIGKTIYYKIVLYKPGLFTAVSDTALLDPSEKQKKFVEYFIQELKREFGKKGKTFIQSNEGNEIKISYRPGVPGLIGGMAGIVWVVKNTENTFEIKRLIITSSMGLSDDKTIRESSARLAQETFQDFLKITR